MNYLYRTVNVVLFLAIILVVSLRISQASQIPRAIALKVLIGEAGNQGLKGMTCVAEVLRRRGSPKGFHGYKAKHIKNTPQSVWLLAEKAWEQSAYTNYTKGADHFANIRQFRKPSWTKHCIKIYEYKDHVFYKEI